MKKGRKNYRFPRWIDMKTEKETLVFQKKREKENSYST